MTSIFITHKHTDRETIDRIKSIRLNTNHPLSFEDSSLAEPICNDYGHINRRPPSDPASKPVKEAIKPRLDEADKLLVLVGKDTHSSLWVQWEIDVFTSRYCQQDICVMRIPGDLQSGAPHNASHHEVHNWDLPSLKQWIHA